MTALYVAAGLVVWVNLVFLTWGVVARLLPPEGWTDELALLQASVVVSAPIFAVLVVAVAAVALLA